MASFQSVWRSVSFCVLASALLAFQVNKDEFPGSLGDRAVLLYPNSTEFVKVAQRWSAADPPTYSLIVQAATEADIQKTILFANRKQLPFLAISGGHGQISSIKNVKDGVGIHLTQMNNLSIVDNGQAVVLGGGVLTGDLIAHLWSQGKQTMSTGCDCVGYISPVLGGGHGWLQGRFGLATDQLLSARLVLANGTALTISETTNPDLFWAIRGAGHNFGIVVEAKLKIYDVEPSQRHWAASGFVFTQDKLEAVVELANQVLQDPERPIQMVHYTVIMFNPEIDAHHPIITVWIYYQGSSIPTKITDPLYSLGPNAVHSSVTDLAGVNTHLQATKDGLACAKGLSRMMSPVSLQRYHVPSVRRAFDIFASIPASFHNSVMFFEGYATDRVESVHANSTAYPDRFGKLLVTPLLTYAPNASLDATANDITKRIRNVLLDGSGSELIAYVNYARGDESVEALYGYEPWRLEKLRRLKKEYDPFGRFSYFAPIY